WATTPETERVAGILLALGVTSIAYGVSAGLIWVFTKVHPVLGSLVTIYLAYTTLSLKSLREAALAVFDPLISGDLSLAKESLSALVGRQTTGLNETGVIRATVESVAENTSDGVVAPLLYMALGGAPAAMAYKAVNTLDSMVGYKTSRYLYLGWASARLDDLANFLPARITGLLISAIAGVLSGRARQALQIMIRDGHKHESPNSGFPEAAMAGALGIQLGGPMSHPDKPRVRAMIGEAVEEPSPEHIRRAISVMHGVSALTLCLVLLVWLWIK
ncbi:MAG: adenosylcobinamide-phosphate synthase CbiB, partial [Nitrospira sp.]|nr:adenosylcobinamide-phosphate synthase CbiB [Nitrospira sp.]